MIISTHKISEGITLTTRSPSGGEKRHYHFMSWILWDQGNLITAICRGLYAGGLCDHHI
ncbi:hypothetical protein ECZC10_48550 [Escherichia coli]|nr:hypothetical protein ECZC10_48550 [Escherichia coli]